MSDAVIMKNMVAKNIIPGAKFKAAPNHHAFFRPTGMSLAMARAAIIPDSHLVKELAALAVVRQRHDRSNERPSVQLAF